MSLLFRKSIQILQLDSNIDQKTSTIITIHILVTHAVYDSVFWYSTRQYFSNLFIIKSSQWNSCCKFFYSFAMTISCKFKRRSNDEMGSFEINKAPQMWCRDTTPLAPRYYQQPPVMRLGVIQMETVGHVFLIPIFERKGYETSFEYTDADSDKKLVI